KCMPNTRTEIIEKVVTWASNSSDDAPYIFWLNAMAGEGKTSIATTVAHMLHENGILGGSFFFSQDQGRIHIVNVFSTLIAY
ncbi:hypothetical protein BV25DRAFT_1777507, partial [Artomyces pyxidatus]